MANVKTAIVKEKTVARTIEAFGNIGYDTTKLESVPLWIDGRLDKLYIKAVGDRIKKGTLIARIYSPELISTQKEYLYAFQNYREIKDSDNYELINTYRKTLFAARNRLKYWGLPDVQIDNLKTLDDIKRTIPIYSKYSGVVVKLNAAEGTSLKTGDILFEIADFSTLWLEVEVNEVDIPQLKIGQKASIKVESYPDIVFLGIVNYIYPFMDKETRAVRARIVLSNKKGLLKPDMYAKVKIKTDIKTALIIPKSSVLYTGDHSYVWIEEKPGMYHKKEIRLGKVYNGDYEVLTGLKAGDRVVYSGGFLIDSEAKLTNGSSMEHQH